MSRDEYIALIQKRYVKYKNDRRHDVSSRTTNAEVLLLHGAFGMGKTTVALSYCKENPTACYFSFRNMESRLAPMFFSASSPERLTPCTDWEALFLALGTYTSTNPCVVFFDDVDDRNDKEEFYNALHDFLYGKYSKRAYVVLLLRKDDRAFPICHQSVQIVPLTAAEIYKENKPTLSREDALRLSVITGGIPALLSLYDYGNSFSENLRRFIRLDSPFFRFAETLLNDNFRVPECYFTLLYAMATGHHRIRDLAAFTGFANNKCDKYLKVLLAHDLIEVVRRPDATGSTRTHYDVKSSYMKLWLGFFYANRLHYTNTMADEEAKRLVDELDRTIVKDAFRKACFLHLSKNYYKYSGIRELRLDEPKQHCVHSDDYTFDFVQRDGDAMLIVKIWDEIGNAVGKDDYIAFENAALKLWPFHKSTLVLFSTRRFSDYCWKNAGEFKNIHLVQLEWMNG